MDQLVDGAPQIVGFASDGGLLGVSVPSVLVPQLSGALGSREVYDGGVGSTGHLRAHDLEAERCLSLPRRTPLGPLPSFGVGQSKWWLSHKHPKTGACFTNCIRTDIFERF